MLLLIISVIKLQTLAISLNVTWTLSAINFTDFPSSSALSDFVFGNIFDQVATIHSTSRCHQIFTSTSRLVMNRVIFQHFFHFFFLFQQLLHTALTISLRLFIIGLNYDWSNKLNQLISGMFLVALFISSTSFSLFFHLFLWHGNATVFTDVCWWSVAFC